MEKATQRHASAQPPQVNGTAEDGASVSGMAEITAQAYYEGLGAGTANASATGNASYNVKEKKYSGFYGAIPMQVWGAVSGTTTSSVKSTAGGSASGLSVIRSGSYAVYAADPLVGNQSVAGMTTGRHEHHGRCPGSRDHHTPGNPTTRYPQPRRYSGTMMEKAPQAALQHLHWQRAEHGMHPSTRLTRGQRGQLSLCTQDHGNHNRQVRWI